MLSFFVFILQQRYSFLTGSPQLAAGFVVTLAVYLACCAVHLNLGIKERNVTLLFFELCLQS